LTNTSKEMTLNQNIDKVMHRLMHLQHPENEEELIKQQNNLGNAIGAFSRDFGMEAWDWPQGVGLYGMRILMKSGYRQNELKEYILEWFDSHIRKGLPRRNINTTCPLLTLSDFATEKKEYAALCEEWAVWLIREQPRTKENGFQHTTTKNAERGTLNLNENQIWIDTLFMAVLFLAKWGVYTKRSEYIDEASDQYLLMIKYLYEKQNGLFHHAWSFSEKSNFSDAYWCRGNSWFTASVPDFLELTGENLAHPVRKILVDTFRSQAAALLALQAPDGLWHTLLDETETYEESSGSAGIIYGFLKGLESGLLDHEYSESCRRGITGLIQNISEDGTVRNVSAGTPVGRNREHYRNILTEPMAYGQALSLMALAEARKLGFEIN
jgi:unsaturated rhamnogalacturonyl hydrolase